MRDIALEFKNEHLLSYFTPVLEPLPHLHKEVEIIYVKRGSASCYADHKVYTLTDNDMFVAFPHQLHYYINSEIAEYYVFIFSTNLIYNLNDLFLNNIPANNVMHIENDSDASKLLDSYIKYLNEPGEYTETLKASILSQLMPIFLSQTTLNQKAETNSTTLKKILDYCSQNYKNQICLDDISRVLHFNKFHISNLLNKNLGVGFNRYINSLRISEALQLMKNKNVTLANISQEVGFGSIRSFNRAFTQIMNDTPTSYLEQIRKQKLLNKQGRVSISDFSLN